MASEQLAVSGLQQIEEEDALVLRPRQIIPVIAKEPTPEEQLEKAERICKLLKSYLDRKPRAVKFNGKRYPEADDWNFVANFFGHSTRTKWVRPIMDKEKVVGYECAADLIRDSDGAIVGAGEAACMKDEPNWARKPDFQLRSMAQTRAGAKACKGKFAWVMVMAGLAPTPAEEMTEENGNHGGTFADLGERLEWIANCSAIAELKRIYDDAVRDAKKVNDTDAVKKLIAAKDKKKGELQ